MDDIGVWLWSSDGRILILKGGREAPQLFALQDGQALRMLDGDGRPLPPSVPSELRRADSFQAFEPLLVVRGSYRYVADAGLFTDCLTRQRWPVAQESANAALESAYLKLRLKPDAPLVVQVHARVATRPKVEGEGTQATLVVQRFINAWPGASCGPRFSAVPLEGSRWTLVRLGGKAVRPGNRAAPALTVRAEASRVSGWGGCNMFKGSYAQTGDTIAFRDLDPRRPCPDGTDTETAFLAALERARKWRILGQILELRDAQDAFVARFEGLLSPLRTLGR
jgi:copper homeostasis protein (lipoprotein)